MRWILRDTYFALRALRRRPLFTGIAIATIAIGIGAATSIYSVVDGVLVRPLSFDAPGQLTAIWQTFPDWKRDPIRVAMWDRIPMSLPEYRDLRDHQSSFTGVAVWGGGRVLLTSGDKADEVPTLRASASLLSVLGVSPLMGRTFLPDEDTPTGARVVMVSYELWQARFAGDRSVVGRIVRLDDTPYTIVGVLPPGLKLGRAASGATEPGFWVPVGQNTSNYYERTNHSYQALGRLNAGVTMARASTDVASILRPTSEDAPNKGTRLVEWQRDQTRDARAPLYILFGAAGLLLLITCVNVATLLLGEAASREQEMAARMALGASRGRIARQVLTESILLALMGSAVGAVLSWWGTRALVALAPPGIPGLADVQVDARVLAFSLAVALATGALFGLAPALTLSGTRPGAVLRAGGGQSARGRGGLQRTLIAVELALSVVLLVGAGLLARTLQRITSVDPGFRAERLLVVQPAFSRAVSQDTIVTRRFHAEVVARLAALPGVTAVTAADAPPFSGSWTSSFFVIEGEPMQSAGGSQQVRRQAQQRVTLPGYFAVLGIPLRLGRDFTADDRVDAPYVAIVSSALARREFPGQSALGKKVMYKGKWRTIVGVVDDLHLRRLSSDFEATIYTPYAQRGGSWTLALFVRTAGNPLAMIPTVGKVVAEVAPPSTTQSAELMTTMVRRSFAEEQYRALLISLFGVVAAVLAAVGIYGVTARSVARRTRELAIRTALGATGTSITGSVVGGTLTGGAAGVAVGLAVAGATARLLAPYLFGVSPGDPGTYIGIVALLALVSVAASWIPARRASRVDIAEVLRAE